MIDRNKHNMAGLLALGIAMMLSACAEEEPVDTTYEARSSLPIPQTGSEESPAPDNTGSMEDVATTPDAQGVGTPADAAGAE